MPTHSLRWTLLRYLLLVLVPTLMIGSALTFYVAAYRVRDAFDFGLLDDARDIARAAEVRDGQLVLELPDIARDMLKTVNQDHVTYAAWDEQLHLITGDAQLIALAPKLGNENFRFDTIHKSFDTAHKKPRTRRIVILRSVNNGQTFYVAVAQTMSGMIHIQRSIFASVFFFGTLLIVVALIGVYFGVRTGLKPIALLRREIGSRSPTNLMPVDAGPTPRELQPIVHNINALMNRLEQSLISHRHFIADAAHQLRTPLAALYAQIEVALQLPSAEAHAALQQIAQTTQRTSHLANQLLSLARLEHSEQIAQHTEKLEIKDLFGAILPNFVVAAEGAGIDLEFDLLPCGVVGNRILLQELLSNLFDNAIRYVPRGGYVHAQAYTDQNTVKLAIIDNGPGVADGAMVKLGTPFFRAAENNAGGCGLGLAIACEIVRLHRGNMRFSRAKPHGGLRIDIELPMADADA
ncbi:MAG TPA: ATP-binding protein [Spongiibacteraceae bacterium]|jgi:two-component system sensor histidine kinase TctE